MDKNRKRGIRIAQKKTYRHHSRDNRSWALSCHYAGPDCWDCEGWRRDECTFCRRLLNHRIKGDRGDGWN